MDLRPRRDDAGAGGLYRAALDQIGHNLALIRPGVSFAAFNERSWRIPERHRPYRYSICLHGVGMPTNGPSSPSTRTSTRPTPAASRRGR